MEKFTSTEIRSMAQTIEREIKKELTALQEAEKQTELYNNNRVKLLISNKHFKALVHIVNMAERIDAESDELAKAINDFNRDFKERLCTGGFSKTSEYKNRLEKLIDEELLKIRVIKFVNVELPNSYKIEDEIRTEWTKCSLGKCDFYDVFTKKYRALYGK